MHSPFLILIPGQSDRLTNSQDGILGLNPCVNLSA